MSSKYKTKSDNELVFEYKNKRQDDLEFELISRYQQHSKILAAILYSKYKFLYQVEFDDLYCIILGSLFTAIRGFDNNKNDFYQYWKVTANNDALAYINSFSTTKNKMFSAKELHNEEQCVSGLFRERASDFKDDYLSSFELEDVLSNPKNKIKPIDADIFRLYLAGYEPLEISKKSGIDYNKVRYRIRSIKLKLANILFNQ